MNKELWTSSGSLLSLQTGHANMIGQLMLAPIPRPLS